MAHAKCDNRKEFDSGAFRDSDKGKINYIACFSPLVLEAVGQYLLDCSKLPDDSVRPCDNWKKGISLKSYMESKARHFMATWMAYEGYSEEDFDIVKALCADWFNISGILHEILQERLAEKRPKRPTMILKRDMKSQNEPFTSEELLELSKNRYQNFGDRCPNCGGTLVWDNQEKIYNCKSCTETYAHLEIEHDEPKFNK